MSKRIIEAHGGHLTYHSSPESGVNWFLIELPAFYSLVCDDAAVGVSIGSGRGAARVLGNDVSNRSIFSNSVRSFRNEGSVRVINITSLSANGSQSGKREYATRMKRVLVVDDDAVNRKMLTRLIQPLCEASVWAKDGAEAVALMAQAMENDEPFDLVLMDYQMPVMDGPTACQAMREMGFRSPVIGVTGNTMQTHIDTFTSHGADAVLPKPLQLQALVTAMTTAARRRENDPQLSWNNP